MSRISETTSTSGSSAESEAEEYDVETIRKWRYNRKTKGREFLIKWCDYSEEDNTWEPEENLSCPEKIEELRSSLPRKRLKYFDSRNPEDLNGLQRNAEISSIMADKPPISLKVSSVARSSRTSLVGSNDGGFVLLIFFQDCDKQPDEFSIDELFREQPEEAFNWIEQRLVNEKALKDRQDVV